MSIALYLSVIVCLILFPERTAETAKDALMIWGMDVVPSLYPYMVFSRMLCCKLHTWKITSVPLLAALGLLGGSPSGASVLLAYADSIPQNTFRTLCAMTGTISPMFLLGTMGTWTDNPRFCRMLLASHWTGAGFSALVVSLHDRQHQNAPCCPPSSAALQAGNPFSQSADAIIQVGGCIICYSVLSGLIRILPLAQGITGHILHAILEVSGGMHTLCQCPLPISIKYPLLAFTSGFGGCSILSQNHALLQQAGIHRSELIGFALLRGIGGAAAMCILQQFFSA